MNLNQKIGVMTAIVIIVIGGIFSLAPIAQDPHYFNLAERRVLWDIPNFGDVVSNVAFLITGLWGLVILYRVRHDPARIHSLGEALPFLVAFIGIVLIFPGSAYFHWNPGNGTLVWDRLPMTLVFMAVFSLVLAERLQVRRPVLLLAVLLLLGAASVAYWHFTEQAGYGDLRLYGLVQFLPLMLYPFLFSWFPPRYSGTRYLVEMLIWYVVAKVLELNDIEIWEWTGERISGHSLKHLVAAVATYSLVRYLRNRRSLKAGVAGSSPQP